MTTHSTTTLTEETLHALVDGQLAPDERIVAEALLARDPQAQATVALWRQQRVMLQGLHANLQHETPPEHLIQTVKSAGMPRGLLHPRYWGAMAASVLLSFVVGWFAHGLWRNIEVPAQVARRLPASEFARQASLAHATFAPEIRHPVEVGSAERDHLVKWLSKRLGHPLKVPDLNSLGFDLMGGRLLPGETREAAVRAQFMFQSAAGERLTLYLGAVHGDKAGVDSKETAFRFSSDAGIASFYWVDQGFGYALSGPVSRDRLMQLAQAVYQQL